MKDLALVDHAELWAISHGYSVPARDTEEWQGMYQDWIGYAFSEMRS